MNVQPVSRRRKLGLELLEGRQVLSGMVSAAINDGSLVITGDLAANHLVVWRGAFPDLLYVGGMQNPDIPGSQTLVNGSVLPVLLNGFNKDVRLEMKPGHDHVFLMDLNIPGSLYANMGSGNDQLVLDGTLPGEAQHYRLNDGSENLPHGYLNIRQNVYFQGVTDNDELSIYTRESGSAIDGNLYFEGGAGNDEFFFYGSNQQPENLSEPPAADDGQNDVGKSLFIQSGMGNDTVSLWNVVAGENVTMSDYNGNNEIGLISSLIQGDVNINTGFGNDIVQIQQASDFSLAPEISVAVFAEPPPEFSARNIRVSTGFGGDTVHIRHGKASNVSVLTGQGDDGNGRVGVDLIDLAISQELYVDTGDGFDNLNLDGVQAPNMRLITGAGSDGLIMKNSSGTDSLIDTGTGGDIAGFYNSTFDNFRVALGSGFDGMAMGGMIAFFTADLDGGEGLNTLHETSRNVFRRLSKRGF